jgi:hypothetical protein
VARLDLAVIALFFFAMANWILVERTISLYENAQKARHLMIAFFILTYIATATLALTALHGLLVAPGSFNCISALIYLTFVFSPGYILYSPPLRLCGIAVRPKLYGSDFLQRFVCIYSGVSVTGYIWVPCLILETIITFLTIRKTYHHAIEMQSQRSNLFMVIYRDGIVYYTVRITYIIVFSN